MAIEPLYIPEEDLATVIRVIRTGLKHLPKSVPRKVRKGLLDWCKGEEEYLQDMAAGDDDE